MSQTVVDLRSDTVTLPTEEMREAMYRAEVGDSMRGEDPTVNQLEALAADILGKEAALYVPSGTMGNLISILAHTTHGDEILFEAETHAYYYEVGGFAALGVNSLARSESPSPSLYRIFNCRLRSAFGTCL